MSWLDLPDIQGNIHRPYGRWGFPFARHFFFHVDTPHAGRRFVQALRRFVTTAQPWDREESSDGSAVVAKPRLTINLGFTHAGLRALALPTRTLRLFPDEFVDGMAARADIIGDVGASAPSAWEAAWRRGGSEPHIWVGMSAAGTPEGEPVADLQGRTDWLLSLTGAGVRLLEGHGADGGGRWQDTASLMDEQPDGTKIPSPKENFGYTDSICDPVFRGQYAPDTEPYACVGRGKIGPGRYDGRKSWSPLETGEFLLGHVDEGQELPVATVPQSFVRNGTFMVWRKLRQDVEAFEAYVSEQASLWMKVTGCADRQEAEETLKAKIVGRWTSGIPIVAAPTYADHQRLMAEYADAIEIARRHPRSLAERRRLAEYETFLNDFRFGDDLQGERCPFGAHIRRGNPRDMLDPLLSATRGSTALTNRRRILRRGMTYRDPGGERGLVFAALCASIFRQFEFLQQQWVNYGLDFSAGNDTCPLVGGRTSETKFVIPAGPANRTPFIAAAIPEFVTMRGGDYFFLPSMTAISEIAMGAVDPT